MAFVQSKSSMGRKLAVARWLVPLLLTSLVVFYETLEHVLYHQDAVGVDFFVEVGFIGLLGPALVALGITWLLRNLEAQVRAEAEIRHLNASLEQQVANRTLSLQEAYQELDEKNRELETLDQLKSEFVSLVSHELRAPLTNINGGIELLLSSPDLSPYCRETLSILGEQSQRLTNLVETILSISAVEARRWPMTPGPVAVPPLVQTVIREMSPRIGARQIVWQGADDLPFAWADETSMTQVLTNLLDNAIKYSPEESTITVGASVTDETIRIAVADGGPGVPREARERIFDKFHRLDVNDNRRVYGHGLGLYMARLLVEAQAGKIWVDDHQEQGARFLVSLPRVMETIP